MPARVVDTNVVSFQIKGDTRAGLYDRHLIGHIPFVSFMTIAELDLWALSNKWGPGRRNRLAQHMHKFALYPYDRNLCRRWAEARDGAKRKGRPIGIADAWIAATALILSAPLVTHNPNDYESVSGLVVISEANP